jgi:hypothetical protein
MTMSYNYTPPEHDYDCPGCGVCDGELRGSDESRECPECDEVGDDCRCWDLVESDAEARAAERRQMGLVNF